MELVDRVIERLRNVTPTGDRTWSACCPAHQDDSPSLSVAVADDGRILIHCFVGCTFEAIYQALQLTPEDFAPPQLNDARKKPRSRRSRRPDGEWHYRDESGKVLFTQRRFNLTTIDPVTGKPKKRFAPIQPDGQENLHGVRRVPYRLPELLALAPGVAVAFVEGEGKAEALATLGIPVTTTVNGSGGYEHTDFDTLHRALRGRGIIILPDNDDPGRKYAANVARDLHPISKWVRIVQLPGLAKKEDAVEWIRHARLGPSGERIPESKILEDFMGLVRATPTWAPDSISDARRKLAAGRPDVCASEGDLAAITDVTWQKILQVNATPTIFRRGGEIVRIQRDDLDRTVAVRVDADKLRHYVTQRIYFWRWDEQDEELVQIPARPPRDLLENVLVTPEPKLPLLSRIMRAPTFVRDGTLVEQPGYHAGSGIYLDLGSLKVPQVPAHPTLEETRAARDLLLVDVLGDFPFVSPADRAAALALLLGPFARGLISGPTPIHIIEKPAPGTGASLMVDVISLIALGGPAAMTTEARDDDEWRKRITSLLLSAPAMVVIDNVRGCIDSAALSSALTAETWSDRCLGKNSILEMPVTCTWVATGNNPQVSTEMARRSVPIRLDAKVDRPQSRPTGEFRHPDLKTWVIEHRGELVHAALTLIQAWIAAGRPRETTVALGSYERWVETLGGILGVAGVPGLLDNQAEFFDRADREGEVHRSFVAAWWSEFSDSNVNTSQLFTLINREDIPIDLGVSKSERAQKTRLGLRLATLRDRRFGGVTIRISGPIRGITMYRLVPDKDVHKERVVDVDGPLEAFSGEAPF